jgi:hypothetical protein
MPLPQSCRPAGEQDANASGRCNERRYAERNPVLVSGSLIFVMLLLILVAALTQTAALP